jgi:hypothetical protein
MAIVNTGLDISFTVGEGSNCKYITVSDTTGIYDSVTNDGGWDSTEVANPSSANITSTILTVVDPAGTSNSYDETSTYATDDYFPDLTGTLVYPILATDFSSTGKFIDGVYTFTLAYAGDWDVNVYTASNTCQILISCQTQCCLDKLAKEIAKSECLECKKEASDMLALANWYLQAAKNATACGMVNMAKKHLAAAQWYCNERNCKNCFK